MPLVSRGPHLVDIVLESSAANAAYKYSNEWQKWKTWTQSKLGVPVLPAAPLQVALYVTELVHRAVLLHTVSAGVTV